MNILIDFLTLHIKTGAGEYLRRVIYELIKKKTDGYFSQIHLFALYDSNKGIAYDDLSTNNPYFDAFVDCHSVGIDKIVEQYDIDRFFIGCAHFLKDNPEVSLIKCDVIWVNHDFFAEELYKNKLYLYLYLIHPEGELPVGKTNFNFLYKIPGIKQLLSHFDRFSFDYIRYKGNKRYEENLKIIVPGIDLLRNNAKAKIIVVSEYTKMSLNYNFQIPLDKIMVLYSPERITNDIPPSNKELKDIISKNIKYYVLVSAFAPPKNPFKTLKAFKRFADLRPDSYLITIGCPYSNVFENHVNLPFLNDSDLSLLYKHSYALIYPSFFEGFGYPPIEAMHFGKPILSSNATSMPEMLADAPIYFCPLYESAIYGALLSLTDDNYSYYSTKSIECYNRIHERQERDLQTLIDMITAPVQQ